MWTLIRSLPAIGILVIGLVGGGGVVGAAQWAWLHLVHDPALRRAATAELTARVQQAAAQATAAEQLRQFKAGELATQQYLEDKAASDAAHRAEIDALNQEIDQYERDKASSGTACRLTQRDIDFLDGRMRHGPSSAQGGP